MLDEITGGDSIKESAKIFMQILECKGTESQNNVVCANAGLAIATVKELSPQQGFELARNSLLSGNALKSLKTLQEISKN